MAVGHNFLFSYSQSVYLNNIFERSKVCCCCITLTRETEPYIAIVAQFICPDFAVVANHCAGLETRVQILVQGDVFFQIIVYNTVQSLKIKIIFSFVFNFVLFNVLACIRNVFFSKAFRLHRRF